MAVFAGKSRIVNGGANDRVILNSFYEFPGTVGDIWYAYSGATGTGTGKNPTDACTTIDAAVGLCTANNGDIIIVLPGHVETITAASGLALDVAGVTVRGIGSGTKQPKIDITTIASANVAISATDVTLDNFQIEASYADITAEILVTGDGCTIRNCRFLEPVTDENALINILANGANTADFLTVEKCQFRGLDAANTCGISISAAQEGVIISNNLFLGVFETGAIKAAGVLTQCTIYDNFINNTSGDADECIIIADTSTGVVCRNIVGNSLGGNATTNISCGTTMTMAENYSTDKGDVQGVLDPVAT